MDKQTLNTLQSGLAQAQTPADMAALINNLASSPSTPKEIIGTAIGAAQTMDSALSIAGKGPPYGGLLNLGAPRKTLPPAGKI